MIWLVFTLTFARVALGAGPGRAPAAAVGAGLLVAALGLRVYAKSR